MASNFNSLVVYRLTVELADELYDAVARMPPFDRSTIGRQLVRAIDSVSANIAESTGRWTTADKRRFLMIARGSLCETEHWVLTARRRNVIRTDYASRIEEIAKTLNGLIRQPRPRK